MSHHNDGFTHVAKIVADLGAVSVTAAALMQWLPPISAALSIIWLSIQIYEWAKNK